MRPFLAGIQMFFGKEIRTRMKNHCGSCKEQLFTMQTFGINAEDHPIKEDKSLDLGWHNIWLQIRKTNEEEEQSYPDGTPASNSLIVPRRLDVLFGRGKTAREHTGNLRAAHIVDMHRQEYEAAGKYKKTMTAEHMVSIVNESCGRFLTWDQNKGWVEVDSATARDKVRHFFRQKRVFPKAKNQKQQQPPDQGSTAPKSSKQMSPCPSPHPVEEETYPFVSPKRPTPSPYPDLVEEID